MEKLFLDSAQKIWTEIAKNKKPGELQIEVELYKKMLQIFQESDTDGAVLRTFVVHTDITDLKKDTKMQLSFIGMDGEPSYVNVPTIDEFSKIKNVLTKREMEILTLLSQNKTTKEIAKELSISKATVATHRKNMLRKTGTHTVLELVSYGLSKGLV